MTTGILILFGSIILLILDIKLIMENDKAFGFLKLLGVLLIFVLFWGNVFTSVTTSFPS